MFIFLIFSAQNQLGAYGVYPRLELGAWRLIELRLINLWTAA